MRIAACDWYGQLGKIISYRRYRSISLTQFLDYTPLEIEKLQKELEELRRLYKPAD